MVPTRSQTPPRKQPGDDRRLVILPWRRLSNQSTKFHRRGCFLFIAVEGTEKGKERNRGSGRRERDIREQRVHEKIGSPEGNVSNERKSVKSEMDWRSGRDDDLAVVVDRSPPVNPGGGLPG